MPVAFTLIALPTNFFDSVIGSLEKNKRPINCNEATGNPSWNLLHQQNAGPSSPHWPAVPLCTGLRPVGAQELPLRLPPTPPRALGLGTSQHQQSRQWLAGRSNYSHDGMTQTQTIKWPSARAAVSRRRQMIDELLRSDEEVQLCLFRAAGFRTELINDAPRETDVMCCVGGAGYFQVWPGPVINKCYQMMKTK